MIRAININKKPCNKKAFLRPWIPFPRARDAFAALIYALRVRKMGGRILLPAYIGWSPKEGSGVFDPVKKSGSAWAFYRLTPTLDIDLDDFAAKLNNGNTSVALIIHYFGFPAPSAAKAASLAKAAGVLIVEDEAHALYSDWVGGVCGRNGDAVLYSFHKMLPVKMGGAIAFNPSFPSQIYKRLRMEAVLTNLPYNPTDWDGPAIAMARRRNASFLLSRLESLKGAVIPLYETIPTGAVPQTLPVLVKNTDRNTLYKTMNAERFGVVSLYHTLVHEIPEDVFPESYSISRSILNLPTHQDVEETSLEAVIRALNLHLRRRS